MHILRHLGLNIDGVFKER